MTGLSHVAIGTANLYEIVWTLFAFLGCLLSVLNMQDAISDLIYLRADRVRNLLFRDGWTRIKVKNALLTAVAIRRNESVRLMVNLIFLVIGWIACLTPDVQPAGDEAARTLIEYRSMLFALLFIAAVAVLAWNSGADRSIRRRIVRNIRKEQAFQELSD